MWKSGKRVFNWDRNLCSLGAKFAWQAREEAFWTGSMTKMFIGAMSCAQPVAGLLVQLIAQRCGRASGAQLCQLAPEMRHQAEEMSLRLARLELPCEITTAKSVAAQREQSQRCFHPRGHLWWPIVGTFSLAAGALPVCRAISRDADCSHRASENSGKILREKNPSLSFSILQSKPK